MVNCVVPVSADNPPAYNLVLVSLQCVEWVRAKSSQTYSLFYKLCCVSPEVFFGTKCNECHGTLQGRGHLKSHGLSDTPIVWRNTSDTFTPRGLGYNRSSCALVKCFELKKSDGELRRSCLHRQPACLQPCARLITFGSEGWLMRRQPACLQPCSVP